MEDHINHSEISAEEIEKIKKEAKEAALELIEIAKPEEGDVLVVGCSTSEVAGQRIGTFSSKQLGEALFLGIKEACDEHKIHVAAQCCEHLNRAIIVEKKVAKERGLTMVNVVPQLKAGGSFATAAYSLLEGAVAVEHIQAELGIDLGDTLIGMHLRDVAVPVRITVKSVGAAHVVCARTRLKYIGGERAKYM